MRTAGKVGIGKAEFRAVALGTMAVLALASTTQLIGATGSAPATAYQQVDARVLELGRELYVDQCEPCHGADGKGEGPAARFLETPVRDLTGDEWTQMESATLESMVEATAKGVPDTDMEPFEELLTEDEIFAVAAYVMQTFAAEEKSR